MSLLTNEYELKFKRKAWYQAPIKYYHFTEDYVLWLTDQLVKTRSKLNDALQLLTDKQLIKLEDTNE